MTPDAARLQHRARSLLPALSTRSTRACRSADGGRPGAGDDAGGGRAYRGTVRPARQPRRDRAHLVTEARRSLTEDVAYRQRRYLIMMGIRVVCFVVAVLLFVNHAGWLTAIPAVGAIVIPYFAVIFANSGREPSGGRGFQAYEPHLPARFAPPAAGPAGTAGTSGGGPDTGTADNSGVPGRNDPSGHENQQKNG